MEKAEQVYHSMMENDHFSKWLNFRLITIKEGSCHLELTVRKDMLNGFSTLHGGVAYAFADSALAFASNSYGRISPLINGSMNYAKASKEGDVLRAEAKVIALGNKKADIDVNVFCNKEETPFYFFRGTVYRTSQEHKLKI